MLTVHLLGPIDIRCNGTSLAAAGRDKGLLLLAYFIATAGCSHTREDLADLFWPGIERERALHNLRQTLLRLRGLLPAVARMPPYLQADARSIAFNRDADYWLDLEPFLLPYRDIAPEMLEQRAALYRGPFMSDYASDFGDRFADWVQERRETCHNNALALEETLAAQHENSGRLARALEHAQRCVRLEPWQEIGQRRLLRLLAESGQVGSALHHFRTLREELRRELGSDVEPETLALVERIQRDEVEPIRPAVPVVGARRRVTALDCGLDCGGQHGSQHGDAPEALAAALTQPCRLAREVIETGGGYLTDCRPNGLTALFGWPQNDEHSARNAARAVLELQEKMARAHPDVRVTVGSESGMMLEREGQNGIWYVTEQAMRLRLTAPTGIAVIGAQLQQRLQTRFKLHSLPAVHAQTGAWCLVAEQIRVQPVEPDAYPLFGRSKPLALLTNAWKTARTGGLHAIVVHGEAGIGKSRLVREFARAVVGHDQLPWCECEAWATDSPLFPVLRMLRRVLDLPLAADAATVQRRLAAILMPGSSTSAAARLLVPLFCQQETAFDPRQKSGILHALCELLVRLAQPVAALVLEDIHWSDATTLELLELLIRSHTAPGLLLVLTARRPPELAQPVETLALTPLNANDAALLAAAAGGSSGANGAYIAAAWREADGVPLFIVELARMQTMVSDSNTLPANLHDLLTARLEQAGDGKALLQAAAVIGREFDITHLRHLLAELGGMTQPLAETLARLAEANLLERDNAHADSARFPHTLLQRTAYESLPLPRRAELHRRYAAVLQDQPTASATAASIAWHLAAGGLAGEAAEWWLRAARQASHMAAYTETAQLAERALAALATDHDSARDDTELGALLLAAYARVALGGYFDDAAQALYGRARALLHGRDADARQTLGTLRGHWLGASSRASYREAHAIADEFTMIADAADLECLRGVGRYLAGNSMLWLGEFEAALPLLEEAVAILARVPLDAGVLAAHDQDFEATATGYLGWVHWYLGHPHRALALGRRAIEMAQQRGHLLTLLHTSMTFCCIAMGCDAVEEVRAAAEQMMRRARECKLAMWTDVGLLLRHWALAQLGRKTSSVAATQALNRLNQVYPGGSPGFQAIFAAACLARGEDERMAEALTALDLSLRATEAHAFVVTRYLLAAQLAQQQRRPRAATADLRRAIQTAAAQGSPMLEMQAWAALCQISPSRANRAGLAAAGSRCTEPGMSTPTIARTAPTGTAGSRCRVRQERGTDTLPVPF